MKLRQLKKILNKMSEEQLDQELLYNSTEHAISGICSAVKAKANLYYDGEDDPSVLKTKSQLLDDGVEKEDIELMNVEIPRGYLYIDLDKS